MKKEEAKIQITKLIEKYQRVVEAGKLKDYNEAQTRNEFIEPFFEFLGWDMRNLTNDNEVTTEENVSGGRVDLAFRLNNIPTFFLEAKAMKVDLDEWKWAEQAINYSWNKNVTWAVLTDFESIKIFNAEMPPKSISQNLFIEIKCQDYINRFDQIWLLSKESFEQKLLDREAQKWGKLTQRKQVGEKLFEDLMTWRILLTNDFKKQNNLSGEELDEGVQRILDRLIFIRTAEDRKIEPNILIGIPRGGRSEQYKQLIKVFRDFDDGFNSKLFAPHYCEEWKISDKVVSEVINGLYETKDGYRYDFSVISADVLGGIYEQYLSFVQVRKGEDKTKSKRKSQGIYYTPKHVVEFIIKETLGEVLKKTKPKDFSKIRILDPACGSGSFLGAAYDKILDTLTKQSPQTSLFAKFNILKDNIFGVDLDVQAVEIAQLNLLLKVLSQKTKLPTLQHNLASGNSLVSGENEKIEQYFGLNYREQKPFNFELEFNNVFGQGGFDVVIGNPPYVRNRELPGNLKSFYDNNFVTASGQYDIYQLFFEKAITLLKENGYLGFITSNKYAIANYGEKLREYILKNCEIIKIIDVSNVDVFKDAATYPYIIILQKKKKINKKHKIKIKKVADLSELSDGKYEEIEQVAFENNKGKTFTLKTFPTFFDKIEKVSTKLGEIATIKETIHTGNVRNKLIVDEKIDNNCKKLLAGKDCHRYSFEWRGKYIRYDKTLIDKTKGEYGNLCDSKYFDNPKILLREIANKIECCFDENKYYTLNKVYAVLLNENNYSYLYLLALLNSKLLTYYFREKFEETHVRGGYLQFKKVYTSQIPIAIINFKNKEENNIYNKLVKLSEQMVNLHKELQSVAVNTDKYNYLKVEIEKVDKEIDEVVYKIYGITDDEKRVIEK
ncbi:MAG: TaqI-like C-terminal specificity domain-containing protein [Patescibacteria group bacterium]